MTRRDEIITIARRFRDPTERAKRIFLDEPSFGTMSKREVEYGIKSAISAHFEVPFRSVVFCGSAHLGFSVHKGTDFVPGESDLDVAIVDTLLFQRAWQSLNTVTRAFTDLSGFRTGAKPDEVKDMLARRGLMHLDRMPSAPFFDRARSYLDEMSTRYRNSFARISCSFYMNEYAFCWKQNSSIQALLSPV